MGPIPIDRAERERWAIEAVRARAHDPIRWCPVRTTIPGHVGVFFVSDDYLRIGGVRCPVNALTAQAIADELGAVLPTTKIVDLTWAAASVKLEPIPHGPLYDSSMMSTDRVLWHQAQIEEQRAGREGLVAGHKKDVVITTRLIAQPHQVAIYGWHLPSGKPIQSLSLVHEATYADYSHGVRLVKRKMLVDDVEMDIADVLRSPELGGLVSAEPAPVPWRHPGVPEPETDEEPMTDRSPDTPTLPSPPAQRPTLREGDRGEWVRAWQRIIGATADGIFGPGTARATRIWQGAHKLTADGVVDPKAWAASDAQPKLERPRTSDRVVEPAPRAFLQARNYRRGRTAPVDLVVIHSMEAPEKPTTAEAVAAWFAGPQAPIASAHYCVDADSVVGCVREDDTAFHAPGANHNGIGIEHAGYARQTAAEWDDAYSRAMLERSAALTAEICRRHAIQIQFVAAAGLVRGERGITTHAEVSKAFKKSTHTDPGAGFPMSRYLELVRVAS